MHDGISEGVFAAVTIVLFLLLALILGRMQKRKYERAVLQRLSGNFGKVPNKKMDPERYAKVPAFFLRHRPEDEVDDITWNDLEMDRIYQRIDATQSGAGEEYLYALLRSPSSGDREKDQLQIPREVIHYFECEENRGIRERLQRALYRFGHAGKYSLYEYLEMLDHVPRENNLMHLPAFLLPLASIMILAVNVQVGILCLLGSLVLNMITYYHRKGQIDPYLVSLACRRGDRCFLPGSKRGDEVPAGSEACFYRLSKGKRRGSVWFFRIRWKSVGYCNGLYTHPVPSGSHPL